MSCRVGGRESDWGPLPLLFSPSRYPSLHLISWWDVPLRLAFSLIQRLLLWLRVYLKNSGPEEKELDWSSVDSFLLCSSGASRFLHTQTRSTSLRSEKDEATVSHIVGPRARFAFQLHLRWNHFRREKKKAIGNVEQCSCQELLCIKTSVRYNDGSQPLTHNRIGWTDGYLPSATALVFLWMDCKRTVIQQC